MRSNIWVHAWKNSVENIAGQLAGFNLNEKLESLSLIEKKMLSEESRFREICSQFILNVNETKL